MYNENDKLNPEQLEAAEEVAVNSYFAYLNEISQYKLLSVDEEISLFEKIQAGDNVAKNLFIKSNLLLVVKIARKYYVPGYNDILDLIQEGNLGLMKAVEQYDPLRGCKFSTYAVYLINKAIQRAPSRTGLPLEIPQNKLFLLSKIKETIDLFEVKYERKPSYEELSSILNVPVNNIAVLMPFTIPKLSLYAKTKEGDDQREFVDNFEEYYKEEPTDAEKTFIAQETKKEFHKVIRQVLDEKEAYIFFSRKGLINDTVKDVKTLARELNMSEQGIRQSEERSFLKLKRHLLKLNKSFADFV